MYKRIEFLGFEDHTRLKFLKSYTLVNHDDISVKLERPEEFFKLSGLSANNYTATEVAHDVALSTMAKKVTLVPSRTINESKDFSKNSKT